MTTENKYKTFGELFYLEEAGFLQRLKRDIRLIIYIIVTVVMWIRAGRFRAEFRRYRAAGKRYYVDRFTPPEAGK